MTASSSSLNEDEAQGPADNNMGVSKQQLDCGADSFVAPTMTGSSSSLNQTLAESMAAEDEKTIKDAVYDDSHIDYQHHGNDDTSFEDEEEKECGDSDTEDEEDDDDGDDDDCLDDDDNPPLNAHRDHLLPTAQPHPLQAPIVAEPVIDGAPVSMPLSSLNTTSSLKFKVFTIALMFVVGLALCAAFYPNTFIFSSDLSYQQGLEVKPRLVSALNLPGNVFLLKTDMSWWSKIAMSLLCSLPSSSTYFYESAKFGRTPFASRGRYHRLIPYISDNFGVILDNGSCENFHNFFPSWRSMEDCHKNRTEAFHDFVYIIGIDLPDTVKYYDLVDMEASNSQHKIFHKVSGYIDDDDDDDYEFPVIGVNSALFLMCIAICGSCSIPKTKRSSVLFVMVYLSLMSAIFNNHQNFNALLTMHLNSSRD
jgi:hypothetical protein